MVYSVWCMIYGVWCIHSRTPTYHTTKIKTPGIHTAPHDALSPYRFHSNPSCLQADLDSVYYLERFGTYVVWTGGCAWPLDQVFQHTQALYRSSILRQRRNREGGQTEPPSRGPCTVCSLCLCLGWMYSFPLYLLHPPYSLHPLWPPSEGEARGRERW